MKGLVDHPGDVSVKPVSKDDSTLFELRLHPDDVGRIIGRQGNTIHAIRGLLQVGAARRGQRCTLEIVEDGPEAMSADSRSRPTD